MEQYANGKMSISERANNPVLSVKDLHVVFETRDGTVRAVNGVSFDLHQGETLGIVGESGCGKSVTAMSMMRLIKEPPGKIASGSINLEGQDLLRFDTKAMRRVRGKDVSMIFQEPMTSLNPVLTVGRQIAEGYRLHEGLSKRQAWRKATEMLEQVGMPDPVRRAREYPHQMSGGMRQRVMIAMALACNPKVLIADEPTTALDVTIQEQILELILRLKQKSGTSVVLITHDLGVVAGAADRVIVMYAGRKVEQSDVLGLFKQPQHPYTVGLIRSIPGASAGDADPGKRRRLAEIPGTVPSIREEMRGCSFAPRCPLATELCLTEVPRFEQKVGGHWAACWHSNKVKDGFDA